MPTTLCFDLDNTLLNDNASLEACVMRVCDDIAAHLPPFDATELTRHYIGISDRYWLNRPYEALALPDARLTFWGETLAAFGSEDPALIVRARDAYATYRYEFAVLYEDTHEILANLYGRYRMSVITNGAGEQQRARMRTADIARFFEVTVASTDINAAKPDAAIFEHALELMSARPQETWHIGDSLVADVGGARNAGLGAAIWLNRHGQERNEADPEPDYEVDSLLAFAELLKRAGS